MDDKNDKENNDKKNEEKIRKRLEKFIICPYCQNMVEFIWVHGHYQCPICKNVVIGCCGDE
jgi:rubrerythrin